MSKLPDGIPVIVAQIGHKSLSASVYSHPRSGVAGTVSWGLWKGSNSHRSYQQVKYSRDQPLADWRDALDVLEACIAMARRQLDILDTTDE